VDYTQDADNWDEWYQKHAATSTGENALDALRAFIVQAARLWVGKEPGLTADWMNKKLHRLGIAERIEVEHAYQLTGTVTGTVNLRIYGRTRAEAADKFRALLDGHNPANTVAATLVGDPTFTDGPEDPDPADVDPDAPTTVDSTLLKLHELIMLGHISGPKYCDTGANRVLASFGLDPIPPRRTYTVTRPVEGIASTTVSAFDEASAMKVAGWRWDDGQTGWTVGDVEAADAPTLIAN